MDPQLLYLLKIVLAVPAGLFGSASALFAFLSVLHTGKRDRVKLWLDGKWQSIESCLWMDLPHKAVMWLIMRWEALLKKSGDMARSSEMREFSILYYLVVFHVMYYAGIQIWPNESQNAFLTLFLRFSSLFLIIIFPLVRKAMKQDGVEFVWYFVLQWELVPFIMVFAWVIFLSDQIEFALIMSLIAMPVFWLLWSPFEYAGKETVMRLFRPTERIESLGFLIPTSCTISLAAMGIGHLINPSAWMPRTAQMFISNVVCDALTFFVTLRLMRAALRFRRMKYTGLFLLVLFDVAIAGLLALSSLYYGLAFTDRYLDPREVMDVLTLGSPRSDIPTFSPYFWVMCTAFLPTLVYLSFVLFCLTARSCLAPLRCAFRLLSIHAVPLRLKAAFFFLLFTLFSALLGVASVL